MGMMGASWFAERKMMRWRIARNGVE